MEENSLSELSNGFARAIETGAQSVVAVHGRPHVPSSGILWQPGVVVTTDHTLRRDEDVTVTLPDGRNLPATLAGRDHGTDIAVLRLSEPAGAAAKTVADSSIRTGNLVLAIGRRGSAAGSANDVSASFGIVSAVGGAWRTWRGGQVERFIRPDVTIFTGFSGGALVDAEGQAIGMNTSALTRGSGVTVPASTISRVANELLATGRVRRGYLGIGMHPVQLPEGRRGLVILSVQPAGPAATAGIVVGDVLLTLGGEPIGDTDDVQSHLGPGSVGKPLAAGILRGGSPMTIEITPAERPLPQ